MSTPNEPTDSGEQSLMHQDLHELRAEHRDLDQVIEHLCRIPPDDHLLVRRLKKRKLALKDKIEQIERMLVPDIPA